MDFDDLKRAWDDCDHQLDRRIHLNTLRLRSVLTQDASVNQSLRGDIDYTAPFVLVQKQLHTNWIFRIAGNVAVWIEETCRANEIVESLQATLLRVLRRHRTLRS